MIIHNYGYLRHHVLALPDAVHWLITFSNNGWNYLLVNKVVGTRMDYSAVRTKVSSYKKKKGKKMWWLQTDSSIVCSLGFPRSRVRTPDRTGRLARCPIMRTTPSQGVKKKVPSCRPENQQQLLPHAKDY